MKPVLSIIFTEQGEKPYVLHTGTDRKLALAIYGALKRMVQRPGNKREGEDVSIVLYAGERRLDRYYRNPNRTIHIPAEEKCLAESIRARR